MISCQEKNILQNSLVWNHLIINHQNISQGQEGVGKIGIGLALGVEARVGIGQALGVGQRSREGGVDHLFIILRAIVQNSFLRTKKKCNVSDEPPRPYLVGPIEC